MFSYYFKLGVRSLRRNPALTALMVLTLAIGVAATVSTLTILHVMSSNPIPQKSERLFVPLIDNGPLEGYNPAERHRTTATSNELYRRRQPAQKRLRRAPHGAVRHLARRSNRRARTWRSSPAQGVAPTRDFFAMFDVPFLYGQAWSEADDKAGADVVVLSSAHGRKAVRRGQSGRPAHSHDRHAVPGGRRA